MSTELVVGALDAGLEGLVVGESGLGDVERLGELVVEVREVRVVRDGVCRPLKGVVEAFPVLAGRPLCGGGRRGTRLGALSSRAGPLSQARVRRLAGRVLMRS